MLAVPTVTELSAFTGRPEVALGDFAPQALLQSTLMFSTLTGLSEYPDDPDKTMLAKFAIMEMADRLLLEQPYQEARSGPFQTETIGSYSYSKLTATAKSVQSGLKSGLFWWDTAIDELSAAGTVLLSHGSVKICNEAIVNGVDGPAVVNTDLVEAQYLPYIRIS